AENSVSCLQVDCSRVHTPALQRSRLDVAVDRLDHVGRVPTFAPQQARGAPVRLSSRSDRRAVMPPQSNSRHLYTQAQKRPEDERLFLGDRVPFLFLDLPDNRVHTVKQGDSLHRLAAQYFAPL